jgi:LysM repeat protein
MRSNRPSRWLAPLALLAAVGAVLIVYSSTIGDGESDSDGGTRSEERRGSGGGSTGEERTSTTRTSTTRKRKTYTVRPGDTLALISERTGVSVEELEELNPEVDANNLTVGQKIRLTE